MKFSQAVLIPVYSTSSSLYNEVFQWGFIVSMVVFLGLLAIVAVFSIPIRPELFGKIMVVAFVAFSLCSVGFVLSGESAASKNDAYYISINGGAASKGYDVKHEDVNKAIKAKYDLSSSKRSRAIYEDGHGATYHDCRVSFTKPVNNHITIESMNCTKGEDLIPVKVK